MNGPGWDTRSPGGARTGSRGHLALISGAVLLVAVVLAVVTGKVFASDPLVLTDSSQTAERTEIPAPTNSPAPPDPQSLFLDLPDPPRPQVPTGLQVPEEAQSSVAVAEAASPARPPEEDNADVDGRTGDAGGQADGQAGVRPGKGARDIPVGVSGDRRAPEVQPVEPGSGNVENLLDDPDCRFSTYALMDLKAGIVDEYLVSALQAVCREHSIYVNVFKTGHTFGQGFAEGPTIPAGYGNAGGYPNTHYFGRGADIWEVDGKPVEGNGADPDVVDVGRMLAGLPNKNKPDVVIGPAAWNQALGYGPDQGWVLDQDQVVLHDDHLHIGYWHGDGTPPPQLFGSPEERNRVPSPGNGGIQALTARSSDSDFDSDARATPRPKETIEPAKSPAPKPLPTRDSGKKKIREKPAPEKAVERQFQKTVERQIQHPKPKKEADPQEPVRKKDAPEASREKRPGPDVRQPESESKSAPPNKKQTTNTEEASRRIISVQYESHVEGTPPTGGTVAEDATAED